MWIPARLPGPVQELPDWIYISAAYVIFLLLPMGAYAVVGLSHPGVLHVVHYLAATAYAATSLMMLWEVRAAWGRRSAPLRSDEVLPKLPFVSVIVSAYLPNEQDLIVDTILRLCAEMRVPSYRLQVILAYNTPQDLPVESAFDSFRQLNPSFMPLRVHNSRSKAENIIAALPHVRGEMTVLLDADHHPLPDAIERAYRWLIRGYDVVQGRCVVRRQDTSLLTRYLAIEFEQIYAISHTGRSLTVDSALFGGSNGYWRTSALRAISMDRRMLTEDIDSSVRALLAGYRIVHDRSVVSSELATPTLGGWWKQRLRWAQGWFQITLRYQMRIWRAASLTRGLKFYWTYLLGWREIFPILSLQIFGLLGASIIDHRPIDWFGDPFLAGSAAITMVCGPICAYGTYRVALWRTKERLRWWFVIYGMTNILYVTLKNTVAMVAILHELAGRRAWVVTDRRRQTAGAQAGITA